MPVVLRGFQEEAKQFLLSHKRAILADEPGVGKSYPTIEAAMQQEGPKLLVCPKYLVGNWVSYLEQYGVTDYAVVTGRPERKLELVQSSNEWIIITYNLLSQTSDKARTTYHYDIIVKRAWSVVIFDEAHRLRGRNSLCSKMSRKLKARYLWMLTGSPFYKGPQDIWPLLRLCDKDLFSSYWRFIKSYFIYVKTPYTTDIIGVKSPTTFGLMLSNYMISRSQEDAGLNLPGMYQPKIINVELTPSNRKRYDRLKEDLFDIETNDFSDSFAKLRLCTALDPNKLSALSDLLEDINQRVVILCWYKKTVEAVAGMLKTTNIVTGDKTPPQRELALNNLAREPQGRLVATIESLKEGLNLQHTSRVVFYEQDWLSETNEQAVSRFLRFGQEQIVQEYFIRANRTVDELLVNVSSDRQRVTGRLIREVMDSD